MDQRKKKAVVDTRRAEQNRAAQRAFRQRKERYVKELEMKVRGMSHLQERLEYLERENDRLQRRIWELEQRPLQSTNSHSSLTGPLLPPPIPSIPQDAEPNSQRRNTKVTSTMDNPAQDSDTGPNGSDDDNQVLDDLVSILRTRHRPPIPNTSLNLLSPIADASIHS